jgi:hypothetical protein
MFREALTRILARLEHARQRGLVHAYALIGGLAVSAWGVPRATQDLDFALALSTDDMAELGRVVEGDYRAGGPDDPLRGVLTTVLAVEGRKVSAQLIVLPSAWTDVICPNIQMLPIFGATVPVVSWKTLILLKLYAGGPQDLLDAQEVWQVWGGMPLDIEDLAVLAAKVSLSEEVAAFRRRIEEAGTDLFS